MYKLKLSALLGLFCFASIAIADSITLKDGSRVDGNILSIGASQIYITNDKNESRYIPIKDVAQYYWRSKTVVLVTPSKPAPKPIPVPAAETQPAPAPQPIPIPVGQIKAYFSPDGGCTEAICRAIGEAKSRVRIQAYSFTSAPIAKSLIEAKKRGLDVTAVLDKSNRSDKYSSATSLKTQGITVLIDDSHAIAHNKIILIDDDVIITGSFDFSKNVEENNAENLLIISGMAGLFKQYEASFNKHCEHSQRYEGLTPDLVDAGANKSTAKARPVVPRVKPPTPKPSPQSNRRVAITFRGTRWGMSKDEVKATESSVLKNEEENRLFYKGTILGEDVLIAYFFIDGQLFRGRYSFLNEHTNKTDYISDYNSSKSLLEEKYGNPDDENILWKDDLYKDKYSEWGMAVAIGHLSMFARWKTSEATVVIGLYGENFNITHGIEYYDNRLYEIAEKRDREKDKSGL